MQLAPSLRRTLSFLLAGLMLTAAASASATASLRKLSLRDLNGAKAHWSDYRGKVLVLNFWATWCGPCKDEIPRLGEIARRYRNRNVAVVLASIDEARKLSAVRDFVTEQRVELPVWVG